MIKVNDYVVRRGTKNPTGIVEKINHLRDFATVRWGIDDRQVFREDIDLALLEQVDHEIVSVEDVTKLRIDPSTGKVYNVNLLEGDL